TIVRIKLMRQHVKEEANLLVVWALDTYPVEREDYDMSCAVFVKDGFFSVRGKIIPGFYGGKKRMK
ncbi:7055_t:CDS:2, partial [Dentiscutata erythropus]